MFVNAFVIREIRSGGYLTFEGRLSENANDSLIFFQREEAEKVISEIPVDLRTRYCLKVFRAKVKSEHLVFEGETNVNDL